MLIFIVIDVPSARFMGNHHGIEMPLGGGIHRISSNLYRRLAMAAQRNSGRAARATPEALRAASSYTTTRDATRPPARRA